VEEELNLTLNEEKTGVTHAEDGGIEFLGYQIDPLTLPMGEART
jgi:hypothetical protein